jgi:hypothetical protein
MAMTACLAKFVTSYLKTLLENAPAGLSRYAVQGKIKSPAMPAILRREDHDRWLGPEPDPRDALRPFPSELLRMWPISPRVNSPMNDDEGLLEEIAPPVEAASRAAG